MRHAPLCHPDPDFLPRCTGQDRVCAFLVKKGALGSSMPPSSTGNPGAQPTWPGLPWRDLQVVKSVCNLDELSKPYSLNTACCKVETGSEGISQYALDFSLPGLSVTLPWARLQPGEHRGASIESD
jgi:hypothetical protein